MKNIGLATVGLVSIKKNIIESEIFGLAKKGDVKSAKKIIELVWRSNKTEDLSLKINKGAVFLSLPSTTKLNVIPTVLANSLAENFSCQFVSGDDLFLTAHNRASKNIPRDLRVFSPREYEIFDLNKTETLRGKNIIIVDDVITTGSSIRNFTEFLEKNELNVTHVVGLMGDRRLSLDVNTKNKLEAALKANNINIPIENIHHITRTEAGGLIRRLNGLRSKDGIEKFAKEIRRIQHHRPAERAERTSDGRGNTSAARNDTSNGEISERISNYTRASTTRLKEKDLEKKTFVVGIHDKGTIQNLSEYIQTLPVKPTPGYFSQHELKNSPESKKKQLLQKVQQQKRSSALESISRSIRLGKDLNPKDIINLNNKDIEAIKKNGPKHLEVLIKEREDTKDRGNER